MARAALITIRRNDHDIRQILKRQRKGRQTLGLVAVVIAKQYSQWILERVNAEKKQT